MGHDIKEKNSAEKLMYVRFLGEFETSAIRMQQKWDCSKTLCCVFLRPVFWEKKKKKVVCVLLGLVGL